MRKRKIVMGVGAAALILGGVAGVAGIAGADAGTKAVDHVDGFEAVNDDFNDHEREAGILCAGCDNSQDTDLVLLWQSILVAEGILPIDEVDGDFGEATAKATAQFQDAYGIEATGEVGQASWATADDFLVLDDDGYSVRYDADGYVLLERDPDEGEYMMFSVTEPDGAVREVIEDEGVIWLFEESIVLEPSK